MRMWLGLGLLLAGCQSAPLLAPPPVAAGATLLVSYAPGTDEATRLALRGRANASQVLALTPDIERWRVLDAPAAAASLANEPAVRLAAPNQRYAIASDAAPAADPEAGPAVSRDAGSGKQWNLRQANFPAAWKASMGTGVIVAVLDSGVDPDHPDLKANLLPLIDEVAPLDGPDQAWGQDYAGRDGNGHGTHVTGIVAAVANNDLGISGGAPGAQVLPIKVANAWGDADDAPIVKGVYDAVAHGARVINLSLGGGSPDALLLEAINDAFDHGVLTVVASGNTHSPVDYPAAYEGVVAVGGLRANGEVASYSNFGPQVSLSAPGGQPGEAGVYSTVPTYACYLSEVKGLPHGYTDIAGTSMAAPLVSAAAALLFAQEPGLSPSQAWTRLVAAAHPRGIESFDEHQGFGALDAQRALALASDDGRAD